MAKRAQPGMIAVQQSGSAMNETNKRVDPAAPAVVITGATQGVGKALAHEFARDGYTLLLVARDEAALAATASALTKAYNVEVKFATADLSTLEGCAKVEEALRRHGLYADILVNNAASMTAGFFQDADPATLRKIVDLNARAVVDLTRRFLPDMIARRRGGILNVASVEGFMPVPYQATYAAAKALVLSLTRALAYETMGTGVRVSALAPGAVLTDMHAKAGAEYSRYVQLFPVMNAEDVARIGYRKFMRGRKIILTSWFNRLSVFARRFTPDLLLVPAMGWLFRVRDAEGNLQLPRAPAERKDGSGHARAGTSSGDGPSPPA
ncbi:MAG: SDR family oxidoreductase [Methyloceanibacter sp.]|nr:SDR family oxidoreductase [Methyloceanibacter sp.]